MSIERLEKQIQEQSKVISDLVSFFSSYVSCNGNQNMLASAQGGSTGQIAKSSISNLTKEDIEFMRLNKNTRKRKDGRYEWQKMIGGVWHREIDSNKESLAEKVRKHNENVKEVFRKEAEQKRLLKQGNRKLIDLALDWFHRYKEGKIISDSKYKAVIENHICALNKNIETYTKDDIQDFLNEITGHRTASYCYDTLKGVFAEAYDKGTLKRNVIVNLKRPKNLGVKGSWINIDGQRKILDNLQTSKIGEEVLFYLMTGARCGEALNTTIDFEKCIAFVDGTKTKTASRYVELSKQYCDRIKSKWEKMFKFTAKHYSDEVSAFLKSIGLQDKSCHSLRHSFSTNLYYLGVNDKKCQHLMGHASIVMTRDTYTTFDPTITRQDITKLYGNLYPF